MVFLFATKVVAKVASTQSADLILFPAIILGLAIAFVELIFVHQDERGMGWLGHGLHAVPTCIIFTFMTMNVPFVINFMISKFNMSASYAGWMKPVVIIIIGLIAMGKVLTAAAIAGKVGEKKYHVFVIGLLIIIAPYAWEYVLKGMIGSLLPFS